jgi:LAO/AO transport system kinase
VSVGSRGRSSAPAELLDSAAGGDRVSLARLLSLAERGGDVAREVDRLVFPRAAGAYTVGMTGSPGAGKSTLTDCLIRASRDRDVGRVAVLAVDPSSPLSGGALLGDRVRMQDHALDEGVFIRSMASRGQLGGLSLAVPLAVRVLDAVGVPLVFVETVGVGQIEVDVAGATDTTVVVVTPGWGDAVQAAKAGLLEVADIFVVNKADRAGTREAELDLRRMLDMSPREGWDPPVLPTVASRGEGVGELWDAIGRHREYLEETGLGAERRGARLEREMRLIFVRMLEERAESLSASPEWQRVLEEVRSHRLEPYQAALMLAEDLGR